MMERLLSEIVLTRARYAIPILTAVAVVDTSTADHLRESSGAIELLAFDNRRHSPAVAQTMVSLGVDLTRLTTLRNPGSTQGVYALVEEADRRHSQTRRASTVP